MARKACIITALTMIGQNQSMIFSWPNSRSVLASALAGSCVAMSGLLVLGARAEELVLRPAFTATNYIRVMPSEPFSDSFAALIRDAVQHADSVQAAAARSQAERFGVEAAAGAELPSAALYGEAGMSTGISRTPYAYGVRVSVPLYDGQSAGLATDAQDAVSRAAHHAAADELAATLVDLVAASAAMQRADEVLSLRRAQHARMQDLLAAIVSERKTGTASKVDTDQIEAQLATIEIEVKVAESGRIQARESFARIAGQAPSHIGSIGSIARLLPAGKKAGIDVALSENPQLAQRLELAIAARFKTESERASFGPDLALDLSAGRSGDLHGNGAEATEARAVFRLEMPFSFGADAVVQQQSLQAQAAAFEISAARSGVIAGIGSAYDRLESSRSSLALSYDALERARLVRTGMATERELGERTLFDLVTAQNAYTEAEIRVASLRYEIIVAEHLLAAQIGRIDDIYGVGI